MADDPNVNPDGTPRGDGQGTGPAWKAQLKDDLKGNAFFDQFGSVTDVGKFALDADGKLKNAVVLPGEGSKDEDWSPVFAKLGKPEKPEGYQIGKPEEWPTETPYDEKGEAWFRAMAHKNHLTAKQAQAMYAEYMNLYVGVAKQQKIDQETAKNTALETLKKEWGGEEGWKANLTLADRALTQFGSPEFKKHLDDTGLGNHPEMVKMFVAIGKAMAEDTFVKGKGGGGNTEQTGVLTYPSMGKK